jgi:hypothetical protein
MPTKFLYNVANKLVSKYYESLENYTEQHSGIGFIFFAAWAAKPPSDKLCGRR